MSRRRILLFGTVTLVTAGCLVTMFLNPARRSNADIEAEAMSIAPLGSTIQTVEKAILKHYGVAVQAEHRDYEHKYYYINLNVGSYYTAHSFPLVTVKDIHWNFDNDHHLDKVSVEQWLDGP